MRHVTLFTLVVILVTGCFLSKQDSASNKSDETTTEAEGSDVHRQSETVTDLEYTTTIEAESVPTVSLSSEKISLSDGVLSGIGRLEPTDKGFRKWDWGSLSSFDRYDPASVNYSVLFGDESISVLEYWLSHGPEDPDMNNVEQRWEYDAQGRLLNTKSYSREVGFQYWKRTYDEQGRLAGTEHRVSAEDTGFELAETRPESSYTYEYFMLITGEPDIYRITRDFTGKPIRIEYERELDAGWEFMYDNDYGGPVTLRLNFAGESPATIILIYPTQRNNTKILSFKYDDSNMIVQTIETKLDGTSPLFTTDYVYDKQGHLMTASIWDHRTDEQGQIKSFSDYDEQGNWLRQIVSLGGKTTTTILRRIEY